MSDGASVIAGVIQTSKQMVVTAILITFRGALFDLVSKEKKLTKQSQKPIKLKVNIRLSQ